MVRKPKDFGAERQLASAFEALDRTETLGSPAEPARSETNEQSHAGGVGHQSAPTAKTRRKPTVSVRLSVKISRENMAFLDARASEITERFGLDASGQDLLRQVIEKNEDLLIAQLRSNEARNGGQSRQAGQDDPG